ncbi:CAMK/CAMK1 protein kinase [Saprolegnia diclina VS20]|uniref:non-specific serine/threonine protein kinase n=1 Tax=Saprolegnia diclina (strain VS20) TaxID=1156394 RepID=T0RBV8_SAPDV|nr:CAMK/CAMK1 protein kinase [Saprolegnia diclina VS20]EQC29688.1 CAMK/CAMK1 protein kinase [Saprolegnia diclina VS20]|eukprot:XP_008616992.1 CAMK/CAMK1 protein kinase [Saprolegnia diclina VS20]
MAQEDGAEADAVHLEVDPETKAIKLSGPSTDFAAHYTLGRELGRGAFSVVREVVHTASGTKYAVKCVEKRKMLEVDYTSMAFEVNTLKKLRHPNILTFYDIYEDNEYFYLVTEFMEGGELFERLVEKSYYTQHDAKEVITTLLKAIKYCHERGIAHRDLKPENILLTSKTDDASIKLGDFGLAITHDNCRSMTTRCGSPIYTAPEVLDMETTAYGKECDIWSIGVITFMLLSGSPPFYESNLADLYRQIKAADYHFDPYYWGHVSEDAKHFISRMLVVDPAQRATADELLQHRWLAGSSQEQSNPSLLQALSELRKFNARDTIKRAISSVKIAVSMHRPSGLSSSFVSSECSRRVVNGSLTSPAAKSASGTPPVPPMEDSDDSENDVFQSFIQTVPPPAEVPTVTKPVDDMPRLSTGDDDWI